MTFNIEQLNTAFKKHSEKQNKMDNNYYPFWNINEGEQVIVRFLPDADKENPLGFLCEKISHKLLIDGQQKTIPCLWMYDQQQCPICTLSMSFYKKNDKVNGLKYWKKKQYLSQVLIIQDPLPPNNVTNETRVGKVNLLSMGKQIFDVIKSTFESGELDIAPFEYVGGCNFLIQKTKQGEYFNYASSSRFVRNTSNLTDEQIEYVTSEIKPLKSLIPQDPGFDFVNNQLQMHLSSIQYENSIDAATVQSNNFNQSILPPSPQPLPSPQQMNSSFVASEPSQDEEDSSDYDDAAEKILAEIRARKAKNT